MIHFPNFTSIEIVVEYIRETFRWPLKETSAQHLRPFPEDHLIICLSIDLGVATWYAQDSNIPKMVQAIFYAMVVNKVAKWGITCRISAKCLMLRGACALCPVNPPAELASFSNPVEVSSLGDAPPASSNEDVLSPEAEVSYPWEITIADYMTDF
ncbi:hypothetical protein Cgig2_012340 [Carnegiea gigantea]|uniref:Uncharacterized protein n=1 Tax=Carnegiea gigantea TaxID=171969 RepID=A0A9Q1JQU1_9CARY|nr:hypothetical protein Cgig2_012340 [Carnegiea gigantea]